MQYHSAFYHSKAFLRFCLLSLVLTAISSCKLEIDASGTGSGNIQTVSGTIDCDYDGSSTSSDCAQEYVNDITECDNYVAGAADTWAELPECTEVLGTYSEDFLATPDENSTFGGWHQNCIGGAGCSYTVNGVDNDDTNVVEIEARFEPEPEPEAVSYTYNHLGQRKSKTVGTSPNEVTTYYIYGPNGELLVEQTDESTPLIKTYVYMEGELIAIHEKRDLADPLTDPEAIHYVVNNHLGQPMYMVSRSNSLHYERYQTPFGQTCSEYQVNMISEHNTRFPGQMYEAETGFHQNWFRDYDPGTGRYLQSDPIGLAGGVNTYSYADQSPLIFFDYYGLAKQHSMGISGLLGLLVPGIGASLQGGISVPDDLSTLQCYQLFFSANVNVLAGMGLYGGVGGFYGFESSDGPLDVIDTDTNRYDEFAAGWGYSGGASRTGSGSWEGGSFREFIDWAWLDENRSDEIPSNAAIAMPIVPKIGAGYGAYGGIGYTMGATLATPVNGDDCECQ